MYRTILIAVMIASVSACAMPEKKNRKNSPIVELEIDGQLWRPVKTFEHSTPTDKHYVVRQEEDGTTQIVFGDGQQGARLPSDTGSVKVRYRGVYGQQGRVRLDGAEQDCK